jgi:hypothetical protein
MTMAARTIRVGCASGFWGDSAMALPQLLGGRRLDYVVFDYLAEITMSILARARAKDENAGFARDFVGLLAAHLGDIAAQGVRIVANAGGVNPAACAEAIEAEIARLGLALKVGVVLGDDLLPGIGRLREAGVVEMGSGVAIPAEILSANAYLGAFPIAAALDAGADIVITGRCVDSALALGPCIHAFGWGASDFDRLAGGSLAGHIIECGAQATGGIHTDWEETGDWADIGYPIAEIGEDGTFDLTKPPGTGGLVSFGTVAEQLVYEIGDPRAYLLPDVTCDFSDVRIDEVGRDRVRVSNAKGCEPTGTYKACLTHADGYRVGMYVTIGGLDAARKAEKAGEAVLRRCTAMLEAPGLAPYRETNVEVIGGAGAGEVVLKVAAKHEAQAPLDMLVRELTSSGTSMAPGTTGMGGNRPRVSPVIRLFSCLVPKSDIIPEVRLAGARIAAPGARAGAFIANPSGASPPPDPVPQPDEIEVPLIALAWGRSGDKGNDANIGIVARDPAFLPYIRRALSVEAVAAHFAAIVEGPVERFELPGIGALNFLLHDALGGGGIASLRNDPQGKALAQALLAHPIAIPAGLVPDSWKG